MGLALISVADRFQLPMGIEWSRPPEAAKKITLAWKDTTVQQILKTIVSQQAGYELEVTKNGVVHVFPKEMRSNPQNFLNLTIDHLEIHDQVLEVASHQLRDLIRLRFLALAPHPPKQPAGMAYSQGVQVDDPVFSLALAHVPVREVLDDLVELSDRKIWVVTFAGVNQITPTGYRRTVTLWNNADIQDSEQPVWDMFRWTDRIP